MYEIKPKNANRFRHDVARLTPEDRTRDREALTALARNPRPRGAICLEKNCYRLKVGTVRIIYQIFDEEKLVLVGAVVKRNERTYKDWRRLFR